jgi:hypothetical protein
MHWMYPDAPEAYSFPNQYIFGSELLVAPIVTPRDQRTNLASVKVWLPSKSRYVDLFMGTVYDDNREITLYQRPEEYPVLLSEGTILTLDADTAPGNGCLNPEALEIIVVVGRNAQAVILEGEDDDDDTQGDGGDGAETAPQNRQQYQKTTVTFHQSEGRLRSRRNKSTGHIPLSLDDLDPTRPESRHGRHGHNKSYQGHRCQISADPRVWLLLARPCPYMIHAFTAMYNETYEQLYSTSWAANSPIRSSEMMLASAHANNLTRLTPVDCITAYSTA